MPDEIQARALETWHKDLDYRLQYLHALMGLSGEVGELVNLCKKMVFKPNGNDTPRIVRLHELGDILYYLAVLAHLEGVTLDNLSLNNHDKLSAGHGWQADYFIWADEVAP